MLKKHATRDEKHYNLMSYKINRSRDHIVTGKTWLLNLFKCHPIFQKSLDMDLEINLGFNHFRL